ncbi:MAG TPA: hypothetical protein VH375_00960 [Rhodanobacteraceae bacterium]|jgi:hypothetical protein
MRYLVCLFGGLLIGALIAVTVANILRQRDAWPRAIMNVMQHEVAQLRDLAHDGRCAGPESTEAIVHLELMASDIEPALLAPGARDPVFSRYAADLRKKLSAFRAVTECPARGAALTDISNACEACHRDYK